MARMIRFTVLSYIILAVLVLPPAQAGDIIEGTTGAGAIYQIYLPDSPPGSGKYDLVVYAHGYVNPYPDRDPVIPEDQLRINDNFIPDLVTGMGYAFAVTSYRKNGLAVKDGVQDLVDLVAEFRARVGNPARVYLAGVSEGGLITTLALEQRSDIFSGGLALCGPIGDFRRQINYVGDFRVVFDYFFPGLLPPSPVSIPCGLMENWYSSYVSQITAAITANPVATNQLLKVTGAATDPADPATRVATTLGILWYNVFGTNDAKDTLGGQPYDNRFKVYVGSYNDFRLNCLVQRFKADDGALAEIQNFYQTSGKLRRPLVSLHNTGDPIVPYWHEVLYLNKVMKTGYLFNFISLPICRYGHVELTESEIMFGFSLLVKRVTGRELLLDAVKSVLKDPEALAEYLRLWQESGALP